MIITSTIIGATGAVGIWDIGIFTNDFQVLILCYIGLIIFLLQIFKENSKQRNIFIFWGGFFFGIATGLKYLSAYYYIGIICSIVFMSFFKEFKNTFKILLFSFIGYLLGFSITGLWWCILLWQKFGNPFFPKLNQIFQSQFALPLSYADTRHFPENLSQWLFYPFYWVFQSDYIFAFEYTHKDFRQLFLYIFCIYNVVAYFTFKYKNKISNRLKDMLNVKYIFFMNFVLFFTYILWLITTSYLRYLIFFELLGGIYIISSVLFIFSAAKPKIQKIVIFIFTCFILFSTTYCKPIVHRQPFRDKFFDIQNLNLPDNSLVLQCGGWPSAVFIPFNNPKTRWIYLYGELWDFNFKYPEKEEQKIKDLISSHKDKIFLIYSEFEPSVVPWDYIGKFINKDDFSCNKINPEEMNKNFFLCTYNKSNVQ